MVRGRVVAVAMTAAMAATLATGGVVAAEGAGATIRARHGRTTKPMTATRMGGEEEDTGVVDPETDGIAPKVKEVETAIGGGGVGGVVGAAEEGEEEGTPLPPR